MSLEPKAMLDWIATQQPRMVGMVEAFSRINSGSYNLGGLKKMAEVLAQEFSSLGGELELLSLAPEKVLNEQGNLEERPAAQAIRIRKRPDAPHRVLLVGHMDTVFGIDHPFQIPKMVDENTMNGPGVADLKGGLVAMLVALEAFEQSALAHKLGWEIIINPDEEIGSRGSMPLLKEGASRAQVGFVYEPAFRPDGTLASKRKGNCNADIVVRGKAAHAGREFDKGRNAIVALAEYTTQLFALNGKRENVTINPGVIRGGTSSNTVPDLAVMQVNIRTEKPEDEAWVEEVLAKIDEGFKNRDGITITRYTEFTRPPKPYDEKQQKLSEFVVNCGKELGQEIKLEHSGGCCDGNNLHAFGLPNVDTMGVRGGAIHTSNEYILLDSLTERASLSAMLLTKIAAGELV